MTTKEAIRILDPETTAEALAEIEYYAGFSGQTCDQMREEGTCKAMELDGPLNKHCVSAALRWLRQPYKEDA